MGALSARIVLGILLAWVVALAAPEAVSAQEPSATPEPRRPPTCAERFPAEGPAGVDLRLGCIVSELVGLYTTSSSGEPPTLSTYVVTLALGVAAGLLLLAVGMRWLKRRVSQRLAPVLPAAWWICPACRSVNPERVAGCYRCGSPPGDEPPMPTGHAG